MCCLFIIIYSFSLLTLAHILTLHRKVTLSGLKIKCIIIIVIIQACDGIIIKMSKIMRKNNNNDNNNSN